MCCDIMRGQLELRCPDHGDLIDCPDSLVVRWPDGVYGLRVHDGGTSVIAIAFCPWCGATLEEVVVGRGHACERLLRVWARR